MQFLAPCRSGSAKLYSQVKKFKQNIKKQFMLLNKKLSRDISLRHKISKSSFFKKIRYYKKFEINKMLDIFKLDTDKH